MIHSLAGGNIGGEHFNDFALVELTESSFAGGKYWYITKIKNLKLGDFVIVPFGEQRIKAKIIRIDKNISSYSSPIPVKKAKQILKKVD